MSATRTLFLAGMIGLIPLAHGALAAEGIQLSGKVQWTDSAGKLHAVTHAPVGIFDDSRGATGLLLQAETDMDGNWSATLPATAGSLKVYARAECRWRTGQIRPPSGPVHAIRSIVVDGLADGAAAHINMVADNEHDSNTCFSVREALSRMSEYYGSLQGADPTFLRVTFPTDQYTSMFTGDRLHILQLDRFDWDVAMHEYGHFIADEHHLDLSPGGDHSSGANLSEMKDEYGNVLGKDRGIRLAWSEGLATYLAISAQDALGLRALHIPHVGDARYTDSEDLNFSTSLKLSRGSLGEDNELTVTRFLYDLYDGQNVREGDEVALGDREVWRVLDTTMPYTLSMAMAAFQDGQPVEAQMKIGAIASRHGVAPKLLPPTVTDPAGPATLSWFPSGSPDFGNNRFVVSFFDSAMNLLFETKATSGTSFTPSTEEWATLASAAGPVSWSVTGLSVAQPATGPYVSGIRPLVLEQARPTR